MAQVMMHRFEAAVHDHQQPCRPRVLAASAWIILSYIHIALVPMAMDSATMGKHILGAAEDKIREVLQGARGCSLRKVIDQLNY